MAVSNVSSAVISAFSAQQQTASQTSSQNQQKNPLAALQSKVSSTNTQLSLFGKVQSSLADLQARAQALKGFEKSPNLNDLKVAVLGFVQAFNTVHTVVVKATQKQAPLANDSRSTRALAEVSRAVIPPDNTPSRTALEKIGITREKDGSLSVDQTALEKALREDQSGTLNTLAGLGQRVEQAAGQQLSSKSGVSAKVSDLTERANELDKQQQDLQQRLEAQKNTQQLQAAQLASLGGSTSASSHNAVATYIGVASL